MHDTIWNPTERRWVCLVSGSPAGMSGIRPEEAVGLQVAWSTAFAPADDQRHCRSNPTSFAQVTPLTARLLAVSKPYPCEGRDTRATSSCRQAGSR